MNGLDDIDYLLGRREDIEAHERKSPSFLK